MAFNKKHYNSVKKFMDENLKYRPWCSPTMCPVEWAKTFLPLISYSLNDEDYEAAKATSDAIKDFLNTFVSDEAKKLLDSDILIVPEYKNPDIRGIICLGNGQAKLF